MIKYVTLLEYSHPQNLDLHQEKVLESEKIEDSYENKSLNLILWSK